MNTFLIPDSQRPAAIGHYHDEKNMLSTRMSDKRALNQDAIRQSFNEMHQIAFESASENISMSLSGKIRGLSGNLNKHPLDIEALLQLSESHDATLSGYDIPFADTDLLIQLFGKQEINASQAILMLVSWLSDQQLEGQKRKQATSLLTQLMDADDEWKLALFAMLELEDSDKNTLAPLLNMLQKYRASGGDPHSSRTPVFQQWFDEIYAWPHRSVQIRILLRTFAFELLTCTNDEQKTKMMVIINELKKIHIFLGTEEQCRILSENYGLQKYDVMKNILSVTEQIWMDNAWFEQMLYDFNIVKELQYSFLMKYTKLLKMLPEICFIDDEQREQVIASLVQFSEQYGE